MTGRIKGRIRHSFCSDIHLQASKLGGSIQKTIWQFGQAVVGKVPGEAETKKSSMRLYVYCTHLQKPDWYAKSERTAHYTRIYKIQGVWACRAPAVMHII